MSEHPVTLTLSTYVADHDFRYSVGVEHASFADKAVFPGNFEQPFKLRTAGLFGGELTHNDFLSRDRNYIVLLDTAARKTEHLVCAAYLFQLQPGPVLNLFRGVPMKLVPHDTQPVASEDGPLMHSVDWKESSPYFPLGSFTPGLFWDWRGRLADTSFTAWFHHIRFRKGLVFALANHSLGDAGTWPIFFKVEEGGVPEADVFRAIALKPVPAATLDEARIEPPMIDAKAEQAWVDRHFKANVARWEASQT